MKPRGGKDYGFGSGSFGSFACQSAACQLSPAIIKLHNLLDRSLRGAAAGALGVQESLICRQRQRLGWIESSLFDVHSRQFTFAIRRIRVSFA